MKTNVDKTARQKKIRKQALSQIMATSRQEQTSLTSENATKCPSAISGVTSLAILFLEQEHMHFSVNLVSFANHDVFAMFPCLKYIHRISTVATVASVARSKVKAKYKPERKDLNCSLHVFNRNKYDLVA